ncbi:MAG: Gldg family protein [candidate division WOR-3 bacterium]
MIGTIIKKELNSYFNSPIAYIILIVFVGVSGWFYAQDLFLGGEADINGFVNIVPILFLLLIPGICMRLIAEERTRGTIETLATLPIADTDILIGKWLSAFILILIGLGVTLLFPIISALLGNLDWGMVFTSYIGLILFALFFTGIGIFASALASTQIVAFVIGIFISFFFFIIGKLLFALPSNIVPIFNYLSIDYHLNNIIRGILDSRDLIYFLSLTFLFLYGAFYFYSRLKEKFLNAAQWLLIGILVILVNLIFSRFFFRLDLTEGNIYSLSKATLRILKELPDNVVIRAYVTSKLPFPYNNRAQYLNDILGEYRLRSGGKIRVEYIDPTTPDQIMDAQRSGVIPLQFTEVKQGEFGVKQGFMGLVMLFEDKREIMPVIEDFANLEYDITSRIRKLTQPQTKTIGFTTGHDELTLSENLLSKISDRYTTENINLKDTINPHFDALVIAGPKRDFDTTETKKIFDFINNKIPVAFLIDRFGINLDFFLSFPLHLPNLDSLLNKLGISIAPGMIMDRNNEMLVLRSQRGMFVMQNYVPYHYFPKIVDLSKTNPITKDFEAVVLPYVSPVRGGEELARTSKASWLRNSPQSLNPMDQQRFLPFPLPFDEKGPFSTINCLSGDKRVVIVGSSKFIDEKFLSAPGIALFMNILDWLTQDEILISIRSKAVSIRPLKEISKSLKTFIQYLAPILPALIFVIVGIVRWQIRKGGKIPYEV